MSNILAAIIFRKLSVGDASGDASGDVLCGGDDGPPDRGPIYLDFVRYGRTGSEYECTGAVVMSHSEIRCATSPGTGKLLTWRLC